MLMWNALAVRKGKRNAVIDEFFARTVGESHLVGAVACPAHLGRGESHLVGAVAFPAHLGRRESLLVGAVACPAHLGRRESHLVGGRA